MTPGNLFIIALCTERRIRRCYFIAMKPLISMCFQCVGESVHVCAFLLLAPLAGVLQHRFDFYCRNTYKFIIIGIVAMKTCAHCAILCTALAYTGENCVIHTIVLLYRVGGTQKKILRTIWQTNQTTLLLL